MNTFEYKKVGNCSIKLDVYPAGVPASPVVLFLHGGALIWGSRKMLLLKQAELYNKAGYTVVAPDYRLAPENHLAEIVKDLQDAIHWVKTEGAQLFQLDAERLAIVGSSAGGYLSLLTGTFSEKPRAIVSFYGYGDILAEWYVKPSEIFLKKERVSALLARSVTGKEPVSEGGKERYLFYLYCRQQGVWPSELSGYDLFFEKERIRTYCPVDNISADYPPALLLHGDADDDVPYEQSVQMAKALKEHGIYAELITLKGAGHDFDNDMNHPEVQKAYQSVLKFLEKFI